LQRTISRDLIAPPFYLFIPSDIKTLLHLQSTDRNHRSRFRITFFPSFSRNSTVNNILHARKQRYFFITLFSRVTRDKKKKLFGKTWEFMSRMTHKLTIN